MEYFLGFLLFFVLLFAGVILLFGFLPSEYISKLELRIFKKGNDE